MPRILELQEAYILHTRPYRETSAIVSLFSKEMGRISAVARGIRSKKSKTRALLQPFSALSVALTGRTNLMTLCTIEPAKAPHCLTGQSILLGLYVNELLEKLFAPADPHPEVYYYYEKVLSQLQTSCEPEAILREFELLLLDALGYGIDFSYDMAQNPIQQGLYYQYHSKQGFLHVEQSRGHNPSLILGDNLLALAARNFEMPEANKLCKQITRMTINQLLTNKTIVTRELFIPRQRKTEAIG